MSSPSFPFSPNSLLVQHLGIGRKEGGLREDFGEAVGQWVNDKQPWTWSRSRSSQTLPFRPGKFLSLQILIFLIYKMRKWILNFRVVQSSLIQPLRVPCSRLWTQNHLQDFKKNVFNEKQGCLWTCHRKVKFKRLRKQWSPDTEFVSLNKAGQS